MRRLRVMMGAGVLIAGLALAACGGATTPLLPAGPAPTATARSFPTRVPSFTPAPAPTRLILPSATPLPPTRVPTATPPLVAPTATASAQGAAGAAVGATARGGGTVTGPTTSGSSTSLPISGPAFSVTSPSANIRAGPGAGYPVIGAAAKGQQFAVTGKVQAGDWWQVVDGGKPGWIAAAVGTVSADAAKAPVITELPATPPSQGATAAPPAAGGRPAGSGHIAFAQGNGGGSDLAVLDVASGKISIVAGSGRQPDVYNDGWIVFKGAGNGRDNLWRVKSDGSGLQLISEKSEDSYPGWAPDKHAIIFYASLYNEERIAESRDLSGPQGNTALVIDRVRGDAPVPMFGRYPIFVENRRIAFTGCDGWAAYTNCGIWVLFIETDFKGEYYPYNVTSNPNDQASDAAGDQLLYSSAESGNREVYRIRWTPPARKVDPKGTPINLSNDPAEDVGGTFSPDGRSVAWISNRGGTWGIWAANADGSNKRLLAAVPGGFGPHWEQEKLAWGP